MRQGAPRTRRTPIWMAAVLVGVVTLAVVGSVVIGRPAWLAVAVAMAFVLTAKGLRHIS